MKTILKLCLLLGMIIGLPLAGLLLQGRHLAPYLEFPPRSSYLAHWGFSWPAFIIMGTGILLYGLLITGFVSYHLWRGREYRRQPVHRFPFWGWLSLAAGLLIWLLAWTRFDWAGWLQPHTFAPLWMCYILVVNALTWRRSGRCLLTDRPRYLIQLFALSACFWWGFEYLNRFVQNWHYREAVDYGALGYLLAASISFSTVLPAVLSTRDLLLTYGPLDCGLRDSWCISLPRPRLFAAIGLVIASLLLIGIAMVPNLLYPFLWLAPLLLLVCLQALFGDRHLLSSLPRGDWRPLVVPALAACLCGIFWELWNSRSLAKWFYDIPLVHRFLVFEMPVLGFAGYFPFGWECAAAEDLLPTPSQLDDDITLKEISAC